MGTNGEAANLFGKHDENLRLIEKYCPAKIVARGNEVAVSGEAGEVAKVEKLFRYLISLVQKGTTINLNTVNYALRMLEKEGEVEELIPPGEVLFFTGKGKQVCPKTQGQQEYVEAIQAHALTFAIGPAGTGKTYLAVATALLSLRSKEVDRIILARPAVEAGEKLGFLPGDLQEKVNPYLRPLYDSLYDLLGPEVAQRYLEKGIIEVAPLAYMRGRTLEDAFIILDEAQNTTSEQMKMFLTRMGLGSKIVVTGDITQIDLPPEVSSGLVEAQSILRGIPGVAFIYLTEVDVVRHPLVQKIIRAYAQKKSRD